jgi:hypothetical protein
VARNLRRAGIAEGVIMKIAGWRTRSVFERYAIVSQTDIAEALQKLDAHNASRQLMDAIVVTASPVRIVTIPVMGICCSRVPPTM